VAAEVVQQQPAKSTALLKTKMEPRVVEFFLIDLD
jgi:hypothetical protein